LQINNYYKAICLYRIRANKKVVWIVNC
jgi:hypothetical protein